MQEDMGRARAGESTTEPNIAVERELNGASLSGVEPTGPAAAACLIGRPPAPNNV